MASHVFSYTVHSYTFETRGVVRENIGRAWAANLVRCARELGREFILTHTATLVEDDNTVMCHGCEARPVLWEMDCDGPYPGAECGQCDWWACVEYRDMQEAQRLVRL